MKECGGGRAWTGKALFLFLAAFGGVGAEFQPGRRAPGADAVLALARVPVLPLLLARRAMPGGAGDAPDKSAFLLLPDSPTYPLVRAREALRAANQTAAQRLFSTRLFSTDGAPVRAGDGTECAVDSGIVAVPFFPTVIVVA